MEPISPITIDTADVAIYFMLFFFLPIWGMAGLIDWYCHKKSGIERTTGIRESILHAVMGVQVGIPIYLCLFFRVNGLILLICVFFWIFHEFVAHLDVKMARPGRDISILEMHAHSYLGTIPLYLLVLIFIVNWHVVQEIMARGFTGQMHLTLLEQRHGGNNYVVYYATFMIVFCVIPYLEEMYRCLKHSGSGS